MNPIVEDYRKKNSSLAKNFFNNLSFGKIIIIAGIILILIAMGKSSNPKFTYIVYGCLVFTIVYLVFKPSDKKILLNLETAKLVAQDYLERMRVAGKEIAFDSKIEVMKIGRTHDVDNYVEGTSGPSSIDLGWVEYIRGSIYKKEGVISIHPYDGTITDMYELPLGFTGRETTTNTKIIPVGVINNNIQGGTNPSDFKPA